MKRAVIRLPVDLVDRLDLLTRELRREHPGESYSRASVARALLAGALLTLGNLGNACPVEPGPSPDEK